MGFSIFFPLGTDQPYRAPEGEPDGWAHPLKRLREWADEDGDRRWRWLQSMVHACAKIGASEIIWGAPWGVPEGSYVPAGQLFTLREEDPDRFAEICDASKLARSLGIERVTEFSGIGRKASLLRRILTLGLGPVWLYPRFSNRNEVATFLKHMHAARAAHCTGCAIDSMAEAHRRYGEAAMWAAEGKPWECEIVGEGYMPGAWGIGWMLWAWQILQMELDPHHAKGRRDLCVISGHTEGVTDPASAVRLGREMERRGWWVVYSCHSVEWVRGVGEALGGR